MHDTKENQAKKASKSLKKYFLNQFQNASLFRSWQKTMIEFFKVIFSKL